MNIEITNRRCKRLFCILFLGMVCVTGNAHASTVPAIGFEPSPGTTTGHPVADSTHGWEFTVNEPIIVTHLGLFDRADDGFQIDHPVGLYRLSDSALLTSGILQAGSNNSLLDHFRYVNTADVVLSPAESYVIAYYTSTEAISDEIITNSNAFSNFTIDPRITYTTGRYEVSTGGLNLPANLTSDTDPYRFGPNFLIAPVPAPATWILLLLSFPMLAGMVGRGQKRIH